jgi:alkylhydroperoxidase/carboxymuconolactone decarboxylase family protein YurZ
MATKDMKLGRSTTDFLVEVAPGVGKAFKQLRQEIAKAGPLDNTTFELILMSALAAAGLELPFKNHALDAFKHGVTREMLRQVVLIPFAATARTFDVVLALHWVDEAYEAHRQQA